jgi:hypothetical protein
MTIKYLIINKMEGEILEQEIHEPPGHSASRVNGEIYVRRENLPMSLLKEGIELPRYDEVKGADLRSWPWSEHNPLSLVSNLICSSTCHALVIALTNESMSWIGIRVSWVTHY